MRHLVFLFTAVILFSCGGADSDCMDFTFEDDFYAADYSVENSSEIIEFNENWKFADFSKIHTGQAVLYKAADNRKNKTVAVNAGHGTKGGSLLKTYSHPDKSPKITGGTNAKGSLESMAVSGGMTFCCGLSEAEVNLRVALILRKLLLETGFDVLMIRNSDDVQLDNIARTVISNNNADINIAIHFDGDGNKKDKGVFYCGVPDELNALLENVKKHSVKSERLGGCIVSGLRSQGMKVYSGGRTENDLTQTSYSTIPTVDIELGNQCTVPNTASLEKRATGILNGVLVYFNSALCQ